MQEQWKQIDPPFEKYSVSNFGFVRNDITGHILSNGNSRYLQVGLIGNDKKSKTKLVHILVAQQFLNYTIEQQNNKKIVIHHKDNNGRNARLDNLEIQTSQQNALYSFLTPRGKGGRSRKIQQFDLEGRLIAEYPAINSVPFGDRSSINACLKGKTQTSYGFLWEYVPDLDLINEEWITTEFNNHSIKISNKGRIETKTGVKTYGTKNHNGYMTFMINGKKINIHRLVCSIFKPTENEENKIVHHKDSNRSNNNIENLEWTDASGNMTERFKNRESKDQNYFTKSVIRIDKNNQTKYYESITEALKDIGTSFVSTSHISQVCNKKRNIAFGYKWVYADTDNPILEWGIDKKPGSYLEKEIIRISENGEIKRYKSLTSAALELGVGSSHISQVCNGKRKTAYGYKWSYVSD